METGMFKTIIVLGILTSLPAIAGVVLISPPPPGDPNVRQSDDAYPDSRWGQPPIHVKTGVGQDYASRAVEDLDTPEDDGTHPSVMRGPAGLIFTEATAATKDSPAPSAMPMVAAAPMAAAPMVNDSKEMNPEPSGATRRKGVQEIALIAGDLGFFPKTIFVVRDIPVRMFVTGASKNTLCIMMDSFQVRKQVRSRRIEEINFTPSTPGKFRFYCPVNGMEGTLIVKELVSNLE